MNQHEIMKAKANTVRSKLNGMKGQIQQAAPRHLKADKIIRVAMTSIQQNPSLLECDHHSLLGCLLTATQIGLEVDSTSQKAHLVPYGKKCTLILGYRGLMELARRSPDVLDINPPQAVYSNDTFSYELGQKPKLVHKPAPGQRGDMTHVYCVAVLRSGERPFHIMTVDEIDKVRDGVPGSNRNTSPWKNYYTQMALKTVVRGLCKWLPCSAETHSAITLDEQAEAGVDQDITFFETPDGVEVTDTPAAPKSVADITPKKSEPVKITAELTKARHAALSGVMKLTGDHRTRVLEAHGMGSDSEIKSCTDIERLRELHLSAMEAVEEQRADAEADAEEGMLLEG